MDGRGRTFLLLQVFFYFFVFASAEETKQNCSQVQCSGPLKHYEDVGCTPVYKNNGDCCAYKYNCDHLDARSPNKCYIKYKSFEIGEYANGEDTNICPVRCVCSAGRDYASFHCIYDDFYLAPLADNCYWKQKLHECGSATKTCHKNESEVPRCVVDGRTYRGGEFFTPMNEPFKQCVCQEGYTGQNVEPFCATIRDTCNADIFFAEFIVDKCIPAYFSDIDPLTDCTKSWRCQNANDTVIPNPNKSASPAENHYGENEGLTCKFGNLTMNIGDQLSPSTNYGSHIVDCTCEVPPTPTCKSTASRN